MLDCFKGEALAPPNRFVDDGGGRPLDSVDGPNEGLIKLGWVCVLPPNSGVVLDASDAEAKGFDIPNGDEVVTGNSCYLSDKGNNY